MPSKWSTAAWAALLALSLWTFTYRLGAAPLLDDPNEGEYAEVAREMVEAGDWISPQLNGALFLNKPPLTFWLIGLGNLAFGITELSARLPSALAGLVIVLLLARLGTVLFDEPTGLLAGFILVSTAGFFIETHLSRPDLILTAGVVGTLLAFARLAHDPPAAPLWALLGLQLAVAAGLLAKGMLALVIPGLVILAEIVARRRYDLLWRFLHPRAWWLLALLVIPWHVLAGLRHTGFVWDYVINQHVLFFFDRKFPRDSTPVPLGMFWAAFAMRLFPWTLFAPLAVAAALRRWRNRAAGDRMVLAWLGAVLLFFSAAASRMEHYSIPALPAAALLLARLLRSYARGEGRALTRWVTAHVALLAAAALAGPFVVPPLVASQEWLEPIRELPQLARWVFGGFAATMLIAAGTAAAGRRAWMAPAMVAGIAATIPSIVHGLTLLARVNSSAPLAEVLRAVADEDARVVYEAPVEYQNCAGFNFYLRRRLDLLAHPDFVPPPYLEPHMGSLFITRKEMERAWRTERVVFITDPLQPRTRLDGVVPVPFYILARDPARWVVSNQPLH